MHRYLGFVVVSALLVGCVDRHVESEPVPVYFESSSFEVSGLRAVDSGFVAFGSWQKDRSAAPAIVWLDPRAAIDFEKADEGIWLGAETDRVEDVFVGITSFVSFDGGHLAVETRFDSSVTGADTGNSIWGFDASGNVEPGFAVEGRLPIEEPGGVIGLAVVEGEFVAPRATQLDDGLRQVQVDRVGFSGDFEDGVGTVGVIDDIPAETCPDVCERGFSGFLDMTYEYGGNVYMVGTQIVAFFSDEPVVARLDADGAWDTSFGTDGFLRLAESQFEGWRAHAAARRGNELAVLLFPPRGEDYRVTVIDLESGEVLRRFDVVSGLEDVHLDHIAAGSSGWWVGGFDFIDDSRPSFLLALDFEGHPRRDIGADGVLSLNRRVSLTGLWVAPEDRLLVAYQKFGITRLELLDPMAPGDLAEIEVAQESQNSR